MAHMSSDGKKFTNKPPMMAHERSLQRSKGMANQPASPSPETDPTAQPGDDQAPPDQAQDQSQAQPQDLDALKQGFDSVLAAVSQGQAPDPQTAKALCEFLEQFSGEEQSGSEEQGEPQPEYE